MATETLELQVYFPTWLLCYSAKSEMASAWQFRSAELVLELSSDDLVLAQASLDLVSSKL